MSNADTIYNSWRTRIDTHTQEQINFIWGTLRIHY